MTLGGCGGKLCGQWWPRERKRWGLIAPHAAWSLLLHLSMCPAAVILGHLGAAASTGNEPTPVLPSLYLLHWPQVSQAPLWQDPGYSSTWLYTGSTFYDSQRKGQQTQRQWLLQLLLSQVKCWGGWRPHALVVPVQLASSVSSPEPFPLSTGGIWCQTTATRYGNP